MKTKLKLFTLIFCLLSSLSVLAQYDFQVPEEMPINNGELEWLTFKDDVGEAKLSKKELILKSKKKSTFYGVKLVKPTMTYAKVPLNMNGDFYLSITLKPNKIDNETMFGIPFNVANEGDYNVIAFDKQFCYFLRVQYMNGVCMISGDKDRIRYKYTKKDKGMWTISIERHNGGDYIVSLNGMEVRTIPRNFVFPLPAIGLFATNKAEIKATHVAYEQLAAPSENQNTQTPTNVLQLLQGVSIQPL